MEEPGPGDSKRSDHNRDEETERTKNTGNGEIPAGEHGETGTDDEVEDAGLIPTEQPGEGGSEGPKPEAGELPAGKLGASEGEEGLDQERSQDQDIGADPDNQEPALEEKSEDGWWSQEKIRQEQMRDTVLGPYIDYLIQGELPESDKAARKLVLEANDYFLDENGVLKHLIYPPGKGHRVERAVPQLAIPLSMRVLVLENMHDSCMAGGHFGFMKTYNGIRLKYYWPTMVADITQWVKSCRDCAGKKPAGKRTKAPLKPIPVSRLWQRCSIDIVGPYVKSYAGNKYLLVITESLSKYPIAVALPDITAITIARALVDHVFTIFSVPEQILSDRGSNFVGEVMQALCKVFGIKKLNTSSYHPSCNGMVERFNATVSRGLGLYCSSNQKDWDSYVGPLLWSYRVSRHETTGHSPHFLVFGRHPTTLLDTILIPTEGRELTVSKHVQEIVGQLEIAHAEAKERIANSQVKMKERYDKNSYVPDFKVGSYVYMYCRRPIKGKSTKLLSHFWGPYMIDKFISTTTVMVRKVIDMKLVKAPIHVNRLKPCVLPRFPLNREAPRADVGQEPDLEDGDFPPVTVEDEGTIAEANLNELPGVEGTPDTPENINEPVAEGNVRRTGNNVVVTHPAGEEAARDGDYYEVEDVKRGRYRNGKKEYLVKYKGFKRSCWEPMENVNDTLLEYIQEKDVPMVGSLTRRPTLAPIPELVVQRPATF